MRLVTSVLSISVSILLATCNKKQERQQVVQTPEGSPVERKAPNTKYKPAFEGQSRIPGIKTKTPIVTEVLNTSLKKPWAVTPLPDGRLLITQKGGTLLIADISGKLTEEITGIPEVNDKGQGGLLDIAIDPDFLQNRIIYWTFSEKSDKGNLTAVAKGRLANNEKKVENATVIYRATPAYDGVLHYGSRILFDKTGNLIFSTGERSDLETRPQAQLLNSSLGKTIRITVDGKPAPGNPFEGNAKARPELYSYGHRNVQGLALHPVTGDLWECEFGPRGGDEVNRIVPGKNYGWPTITYGIEYDGNTIGEGKTQMEGMEQPVYYWDPVVSPSGMTFYSGNAIPEWENNLFIGGLSSQHIVRLVIQDNKVIGEERLLESEGERFRDVAQGKDGALYAITDSGKLYRIAKK
ncbi:PQQ-dependent sugar dehydrogenase [Flavobacterium wongokense]|uniref:PQQ-dependent sugar dehydrogenase n=1 Tax=Flavobacterium wongokense TaxID=2910674 RepID=UPI001F376C87|nr:PQQ-dependent sugar dehydrogenase [Flavobacterium sp. WG47]MCF6133157.1 PQQ-dependent sugar dehydrogenase [Flavobacterium sp. WG47]